MPKLSKDVKLHQDVQNFVKAAGTVSQAARELGVDRVTLWRFYHSGCALDRTRHALSQAISRNKSVTTENLAHETTTTRTTPRVVSEEDLRTMRSICNGMMTLIEMYEQQLSGGMTDIGMRGRRASAAVGDTDNNADSGARG